MLWRRLRGAALLLGPVLLLFWCEDRFSAGWPGIYLMPVAAAVAGWGAIEMVGWMRHSRLPVVPWVAMWGSPAVVLGAYLAGVGAEDGVERAALGGGVVSAICLCLVLLHCMALYQSPDQWLTRVAHTMLVVSYIGGLLSFLVLLRLCGPERRGLLALFSTLLIVKTSDVGAYFAGKIRGRHHFAPRLSPRKTWEGVCGGLLTGTVFAGFGVFVLGPWLVPNAQYASWPAVIGYGLTVTVAGIFGDLAESLFKRDLQLKDAGTWIPGLGGVMDVLDSVLFAAPVAFVWWYLKLV